MRSEPKNTRSGGRGRYGDRKGRRPEDCEALGEVPRAARRSPRDGAVSVRTATASAQQAMSAWPMSMSGIAVARDRQNRTATMSAGVPTRATTASLVSPTWPI